LVLIKNTKINNQINDLIYNGIWAIETDLPIETSESTQYKRKISTNTFMKTLLTAFFFETKSHKTIRTPNVVAKFITKKVSLIKYSLVVPKRAIANGSISLFLIAGKSTRPVKR